MTPTPYGFPFRTSAIPLKVRGVQKYFPRNVNNRILPPNQFNEVLDCEADVWNWIVAQGGLSKICPGMGTVYDDPPWIKMPAQGRRFSKIGSIALPPASGAFGADIQVVSMVVPQGWDGTIISTVNQFTGQNFFDGSGDISWRLLINQRYVKDMGNIQVTLGTTTQPWPVNSGSIRIQSRQLIQMVANVANANPVNGRIVCAMFGWFYPR